MPGSQPTAAILRILLPLLLVLSTVCFVAQGESDPSAHLINWAEGSDIGSTNNGIEGFGAEDFKTAPGVKTVFHFPNNADKAIPAGEPAEVLVGIANNGDIPLNVRSIWATLHLPFDYQYPVQNFSALEFNDAIVPSSIQASFLYTFTVSKYLQPGSFTLIANVKYEIDRQLHESAFYNGTIEVVEAGGFVSGETLFLATLGLGMFSLFGMWIYGHFQKLSKTRRTPKKDETGTRNTEALTNEWLQGTAFAQKLSKSISQPSKSKKKK